MDLYIVHLFYITACVSFCYYAGYESGRKKGTRETINVLIDDKVVSPEKLKEYYIGK